MAVARQAKYQYLESVQIRARFGSRRRRIFDNDLSVEHACGCRRRSKGLGHLAYAKLPLPDVWRAVAKSGRTIVNDKAQPAQICWSDDGYLVLGHLARKYYRRSRRRQRRSGKARTNAYAIYMDDHRPLCLSRSPC